MRPTLFLRIASIVTLFYFLGHTSGYPWTPELESVAAAPPVIGAMHEHTFEIVGSTRTYWDFYIGFGFTISLFLLIMAIVLWQLASLAKTDAGRVRSMIAVFLIGFAANTVLAWKYFFAIPLATSAAVTICLALAFVTARRRDSHA